MLTGPREEEGREEDYHKPMTVHISKNSPFSRLQQWLRTILSLLPAFHSCDCLNPLELSYTPNIFFIHITLGYT
jgi:hypothetical protein